MKRTNSAETLEEMIHGFRAMFPTTPGRVTAIRAALDAPGGRHFRNQLGEWTTRVVPVEMLVPEDYARWRPLVHDAMMFVVSRLGSNRLAPKVIEQLELPPDTPAEQRLLRFISEVPGLQKIGQVLARNRKLDPALRRALSELENGISDVGWPEMRDVIQRELGPRLKAFSVRLESAILAEASVSAVVPFTWRNPRTRRRERGVFKVLKPHIPGCFAEDMGILQQLARKLARKHRTGGVSLSGFAETLTDVRLLLEREVDFAGEQKTLPEAKRIYGSIPGVRVPGVIEPLCTAIITALTREAGTKITEAMRRGDPGRFRVSERLAQALIAVPALSLRSEALFHADPHAGNLLFDTQRHDSVILDWALTDHLTREQRRYVFLLIAKLMLRDIDGVCTAIDCLRHHHRPTASRRDKSIRDHVKRFLECMPLMYPAGPMDARLVEEIALEGVRFPAPLIMFRKASFTLEGVMKDIAGADARIDTAVQRYACDHYIQTAAALTLMLTIGDWLGLAWSAAKFPLDLFTRGLAAYNPRNETTKASSPARTHVYA